MNSTMIHVVSHTHWDREWQKTFSEYRTRLIKFMDDLILMLEDNEKFETFMLDGQTSLIEDYLTIKPNMAQRLGLLIKSGRIVVGPWYVQPDEFIPSGESLLRNLLIGELMSQEYERKMKVGYLPDSFGQSRFIPHILNLFDIKTAIAMRGFNKNTIKTNEFIWEGTSNSEVLCSVLWNGYNNGYLLTEDMETSKQSIQSNLSELKDSSFESNILVLAGSDQATVKEYIPQLLEKLNDEYEDVVLKQSTLEDYLESVEGSRENAARFSGDFRQGQKQRVHISIAGSRTDIKQRNYDIQTKMEKILEPISTLGFTLNDRYEEELLTYSWKKIVESHAHDSICTVCTDKVHTDMLARIGEVDDIFTSLKKARLNYIMDKIRFNEKDNIRPVVVFNTNSYKQVGLVEVIVDVYSDFILLDNSGEEIEYAILEQNKVDLKDYRLWLKENPSDVVTRTKIKFRASVEGIGFNTYYIKEVSKTLTDKNRHDIKTSSNSISNNNITISVNEDGTFNFINKKLKKAINEALFLVNEGNAGDSYDYSPPKSDEIINSKDFESKIIVENKNDYEASIRVLKHIKVNENTLNEKRSEEKVDVPVEIICRINKWDDYVDLKVIVNNTAKNHRFSLVIPNFTNNYHFREGSFGDVLTNNFVEETDSLAKGWKEYYYPIFSTQRYVYDCDSHVALFNKGIPSYEIVDEKDLKVHLLTTTDYMGKTDLKFRPGRRSGGFIPTPDALLIGKQVFEFRVDIFNKKEEVYKTSDEYQNPLFAFYRHKNTLNGFISDEASFFSSLNSNVSTSALVKDTFSNDVIWRIKNMSDKNLSNVELEYNSNLYEYTFEVNMINQKRNDRVNEELIYNYVGEEYEGSGELQKTGKITISNLKSNEVCNLKFSRILK